MKEKQNHHQAMLEDVTGARLGKVSKSNVLSRELCEVFLSAFLAEFLVAVRSQYIERAEEYSSMKFV